MKFSRLVMSLVSAIILCVSSLNASAAMVTVNGADVSFTYDDSTLFGVGNVVGNSINFNPVNFLNQTSGNTAPVLVTDTLNIIINSLSGSGFFLDALSVIETGDYTLSGQGSEVSASIRTQVTSNTQTINGTAASSVSFSETGPITSTDDLSALNAWTLKKNNDWEWAEETSINFQIQNNLLADTDDADGFAFIQKKSGGISVEVNPVPLPAAIWFLGAGIAALAGFSRARNSGGMH